MTINNVVGVRTDIAEMLDKIRAVNTKTSVFHTEVQPAAVSETATPSSPFESIMNVAKQAIDTVNHVELSSNKLQAAYVAGDPDVSMSQVVVASQKSKLALEGLMVVRNKILESYKEIMNMQV